MATQGNICKNITGILSILREREAKALVVQELREQVERKRKFIEEAKSLVPALRRRVEDEKLEEAMEQKRLFDQRACSVHGFYVVKDAGRGRSVITYCWFKMGFRMHTFYRREYCTLQSEMANPKSKNPKPYSELSKTSSDSQGCVCVQERGWKQSFVKSFECPGLGCSGWGWVRIAGGFFVFSF